MAVDKLLMCDFGNRFIVVIREVNPVAKVGILSRLRVCNGGWGASIYG